MADAAANTAPVKDDAIAHLYGRKGATVGDGFVKYAENQFAHAVGLSASDKGKTPYIDANGDYARLAIGANGSIVYAASGLPAWLGPGSNGGMLYLTSGAPAWLAPGTNGHVLTMTAGAPAWTSAVPAAMTQISTQTVSSPVSAVTFTSIPATGYSRFVLVGIDVVSAAAATTSTLHVQVSTDNGSTFKTTSGDYYTSGTTAAVYLTRALVPGANSTYQHGYFILDLFGLGNASRATSGVKAYASPAGISVTNVDTTIGANGDAAMRVVVETDNAFRCIIAGGSNISSGKFILYGVTET